MKKIMFLAIAVIAMVFSACSKDDENAALDGTVWVSDDDDSEVFTLTFHKSTFNLVYTYDKEGDGKIDETDEGTGSYTFDDPNVVLELDGEKEYGTVSGNKMTFGSGKDQLIYHKK